MGLEAGNPVVGGTVLRRAAIQSPNFQPNEQGWSVNQDGTAQFSGITLLDGTELRYSPKPGLGNLIGSSAPFSGTDVFGNAYLAGEASYTAAGSAYVASVLQSGGLYFYQNLTFGGAYTVFGIVNTSGTTMVFSGAESFFFVGSVGVGPAAQPLTFLSPSFDTTGVTDADAIVNAFSSVSGTVVLLPGDYYVRAGQVVLQPGQYLAMSGINSTVVHGVGTGIVIQQTWTGAYDSTIRGGGIGGLLGGTVDISDMGAGSEGVRIGNIFGLSVNVEVNDTSNRSPALIGIHPLNDIHWTENLQGYMAVNGCTIAYDVSDGPSGQKTSTSSFKGINVKHYVNTRAITANNGLMFLNGATAYDGFVGYTANFGGAASGAAGACLTIAGTVPAGHPGAGSSSSIRDCVLQWGPECLRGTVNPMSIDFGGPNNVIDECSGTIDFGQASDVQNFASSNWAGTGSFFGTIAGDPTLLPLCRLRQSIKLDQGLSILHTNSQALSNGATITTAGLTGILTTGVGAGVTGIIMQPGTTDGQLMTVINQSGSGSITFAVSATSHVADGTSDIIAPITARTFVWSVATSLWYRIG